MSSLQKYHVFTRTLSYKQFVGIPFAAMQILRLRSTCYISILIAPLYQVHVSKNEPTFKQLGFERHTELFGVSYGSKRFAIAIAIGIASRTSRSQHNLYNNNIHICISLNNVCILNYQDPGLGFTCSFGNQDKKLLFQQPNLTRQNTSDP